MSTDEPKRLPSAFGFVLCWMIMKRNSSGGLSRRDALKTLGVAGAAGAAHLFGQQVNKSTAKGGRIDVHHHHAPPALQVGPGRAGRAPWTPEVSLQQMDKFD